MRKAMKILYLGPRSELLDWLETKEKVDHFNDDINVVGLDLTPYRFLISYNYRYIIGHSVLNHFPDRAINLHISALPWNRGADPNLWSFLEDTPKGVTIHYLDEDMDTGDIIIQRELLFNQRTDTLRTTYETLHAEIQCLFKHLWPKLKKGKCNRVPQLRNVGSCHTTKERDRVKYLLTRGWDTPVYELMEYAFETRQSIDCMRRYREEIMEMSNEA